MGKSQANFQEDPLDLAMFRKTLVEPTAQGFISQRRLGLSISVDLRISGVKKMNGNKLMNGTTLKKTNGFTTLNSEPIHLTCRGEFIAPAICTESATGRKNGASRGTEFTHFDPKRPPLGSDD